MASLDFNKIISDLNKRFAEPLAEFYKRRIIFWHDEEGDFKDKIGEIQLDKAKILVLTPTNNFYAKKLLTVDDTTNNYLVYRPFTYESEEDNWLLNIELYSEEFRADIISIWMHEMDLPPSVEFRNLVKNYKKFFAAQARREAFKKLKSNIDTPPKFHLGVMAAICGLDNIQPNSIIKAVITRDSNIETNDLYQGLVTYKATVPFWALVEQATGYYDGQSSSLDTLLKHIFLTATSRTLSMEYLQGLENFISIPHQAGCYDLVSEFLGGDQQAEILLLLRKVEDDLDLRKTFASIPLEDLLDIEIFPCIDECILARLMEDINNNLIDPPLLMKIVEKRRTLVWYSLVPCYYEGVFQVAKMQDFYLNHSDGFHELEASRVWSHYTEDYYRMDSFYRHFHLAFGNSLILSNEYLDDLFKQVSEQVEGLYSHWFLGQLGENWSKACADDLAQYGYILNVDQQRNFYRDKIQNQSNRVFVIISDALRYEVAVSLAEQLRRETQSELDLSSLQGIFPTATKFGMAALLPHKDLTVVERTSGGLQVLADGMSTDSNNRDKVLKTNKPNSIALKYKDIALMKRGERTALVKGMDLVYIYHDKIDEASHISDSSVFPACDDAIEEIKNIVRIIRNEFSGTRIFITADHGFIFTNSPLSEDSKVDKTTVDDLDVEIDRRYLITKKGADPTYLQKVKFLDPSYDSFTPRDYVRIRKKGGGLNFVHGGISLQEMVVPLIEYHYLRNDSAVYKKNKDLYDTKPVEVDLLSASRKITNMVFSLDFYQKDPVGYNYSPASYLLYFVDEFGQQISDRVKVIADKSSDDVLERKFRLNFNLKPLNYKKTLNYYLVIEDERGDQLPKKEEFQIDLAFITDEFDFFG